MVGNCIVPFDISRPLVRASVFSPNVFAQGRPLLRIGDVIAGVDGDAGAGVISSAARQSGNNVILTGAPNVNANCGKPAARNGSLALMNVGGAPNTIGRIVTETAPPLVAINNGRAPCKNPPQSSPELEKLTKLKESLKSIDPSRLDEYVRFGDTSKILDGWIAKVDIASDGSVLGTWANWEAQGARAVAGFAKDIALGLGNLAYTGAKLMTPGGQIHAELSARILAENIRLGNVCLETLKQAARASGKELARPVVEAWDKGNYVEAVGRAGLEIGSLLLAVGDLAKLASGARAAKLAQAGKAAELQRLAEAEKAAAEAQRLAEAEKLAKDGVKILKAPRFSRADARKLILESENRKFDKNVGHNKDHVPYDEDPKTLAESRPKKQDTTTWRSESQAERDLTDIMNTNKDKIDALKPGEVTGDIQDLGSTRQGFNSKWGAEATPVNFNQASWGIGRLDNGELHLLHFSPKVGL
jgi:hypothetical protein